MPILSLSFFLLCSAFSTSYLSASPCLASFLSASAVVPFLSLTHTHMQSFSTPPPPPLLLLLSPSLWSSSRAVETPLACLAEVIPCDSSAHVVMLWAYLSLILQLWNSRAPVQLWPARLPACLRGRWPGPVRHSATPTMPSMPTIHIYCTALCLCRRTNRPALSFLPSRLFSKFFNDAD